MAVELYAVVDKSEKNQRKNSVSLPEDDTAESDPPPPIPERSEYFMTTADTPVNPGTEMNEDVCKSVVAAAEPVSTAEEFDMTYSTIAVGQPATSKRKDEVRMDADSKTTPAKHEGYDILQHPKTAAPVKPLRSFDTEYSMVTLDNVHSTLDHGDLPQQPAETDMGTDMDTGKTATVAAAAGSVQSNWKTTFKCILIFIAIAMIIALVSCIAFLFVKIAELETRTAFLQPGKLAQDSSVMMQLLNINESLSSDLNNSINSHLIKSLGELKSAVDGKQGTLMQQLNNSFRMVYDHPNLNTDQLNSSIETISGNITAIQDKTQHLIDRLQIGQSEKTSVSSCVALRGLSPSGYYWVRTSNGSAVRVYCDMTRSCGGVTGGWVRVAHLNKTNSSQNGTCPSGLSEHTVSTVHTCKRTETSAGCSSVQFTTHQLSYSKVCGRITALTSGAPDGFMPANDTDINGTYVDGVSLTHGALRQHIWTFAATASEGDRTLSCSCNNRNTAGTPPPEYVGNDYFCDIRNRESGVDRDLVLWQGTGCTSSNACCSFNNPPWFYKQLPHPTTDDIEMRVCRDEEHENEDILIQTAELYIQ